jgi:predicted DNA binding protein
MNNLTAQFNLFKKQWMDGNTSLNFIQKTELTKEEKMIVKENFKQNSIKVGITRMAKQFGISEPALREYISTII